jgi:hypothetical protein
VSPEIKGSDISEYIEACKADKEIAASLALTDKVLMSQCGAMFYKSPVEKTSGLPLFIPRFQQVHHLFILI